MCHIQPERRGWVNMINNPALSIGGFGTVLWHINYCRLFNAKSSWYIYIKYIWFGLVWFDGISTLVDYLMPNPLNTYILNIYDLVWLGFMVHCRLFNDLSENIFTIHYFSRAFVMVHRAGFGLSLLYERWLLKWTLPFELLSGVPTGYDTADVQFWDQKSVDAMETLSWNIRETCLMWVNPCKRLPMPVLKGIGTQTWSETVS